MMNEDSDRDEIVVFASELGWMCLELRDEAIRQLSFGHPTAAAAIRAVAPGHAARHKLSRWQTKVVARLQRYAEGAAVDFSDLRIDSGVRTEFQTSVLNACRKIPYGATSTYGELAQAARRGGAARAVGNCMAGNCVPLIIPCHRVIRAGGEIGPYSAAGGRATKRRLLQMEAAVSQQISPNARHLG